MDIKLIKLTQNDWSYFAKWWRDKELITLTSGNFEMLTDTEIKNQVINMANDKNSHHFLIQADSEIVGHINLNKTNPRKAELQIVIGKKDYWNKGIGFGAGKEILNKAHELGYATVYIEVRPTNLRAIHLYKKLDFKNMGTKKYPDNPNLSEVIVMEIYI